MGAPKRELKIQVGVGVKPVSFLGTERLMHSAISYAIAQKRKSVTLVHKGNIMKFTEGAFRDWGYAVAKKDFLNDIVTERETWILGNKEHNPDLGVEANARLVDPGFEMMSDAQKNDIMKEVETALLLWPTHGDGKWKTKLLIKDTIADIVFQQTITRAREFDVLASPNLNGDYLSDALAAQVGGVGIAPGARGGYPHRQSSGKTTRVAPAARARSVALRTLAALPARSPTVGFTWARAMRTCGGGIGRCYYEARRRAQRRCRTVRELRSRRRPRGSTWPLRGALRVLPGPLRPPGVPGGCRDPLEGLVSETHRVSALRPWRDPEVIPL